MVDLAADIGLELISLTDHDTLEGIPEARARASERGLELMPGVEISTQHPRGGERHVLAHGIEIEDEPLRRALAANATAREERLLRMLDALATAGLVIAEADVRAHARGSIGRPHVADAMVRQGLVKSRQEAFDRWLGDGKVGHVKKASLDAARAIELVHRAGGVATLAHPGRRWDLALVEDLVRLGLDGVEVIHPSNAAPQQAALRDAAERWGLLVTGGSDNHGDAEGRQTMKMQIVPRALADAVAVRVRERQVRRVMGAGA